MNTSVKFWFQVTVFNFDMSMTGVDEEFKYQKVYFYNIIYKTKKMIFRYNL